MKHRAAKPRIWVSAMPAKTLLLAACAPLLLQAGPAQLSGVYPSLAMFNEEGECGTGAVVPWADRLWVITYAPHKPLGSTDKLYEITPDLRQIVRPESIGGTPANRMIHPESEQLFIGPYAIDSLRRVRAIPYQAMFGRHTGNARHLSNPAGKILFATMEEGVYEVDVTSLQATELWGDEQSNQSQRRANLPGYHGKGFYSGQGVYIYANNGEHGEAARTHPDVPSGVLAEWDGKADAWKIVRRNQFTEVTGPGGIHGNPNPATDPIWASGWDHKSLLLGVRTPGAGWVFYRLPKGSHSYDGAHGWNTEWPRIREVGGDDLLMTMHGTFWKFPKTFTPQNSAGISPRSNYLKVIGDFCRWRNHIVLGCDDTAKSEFLNKRRAKGEIAAPQSQSNLWFVEPARLDQLGPAIGRGAVWEKEDITAGTASDPFLFAGYDHRCLHLSHSGGASLTVTIETSPGDGSWTKLRDVTVPATGYLFTGFSPADKGVWIRLTPRAGASQLTAAFSYRNKDVRPGEAAPAFRGLARPGQHLTGGLLRARDGNKRTLAFAAMADNGSDIGYYELDAGLSLKRVDSAKHYAYTRKHSAIASNVLSVDAASVLFIDDDGKRWRLPKGDSALDAHPLGNYRVCREVATERDLFNAHGTFYELPANNAGGFSKVRPVATHNSLVHDYGSYRGLFLISGIATAAPAGNPHILKSDDGKTALWAGVIDDVWKLGKPRGNGGPWMNTKIKAGVVSDPYLMTAYDQKLLQLRFDDPNNDSIHVTAQIDIFGNGHWVDYKTFLLENGETTGHEFPESFSAYWIRFVADEDSTATAQLIYR